MKNRNPLIAGIMSIMFLGLGQLYNGQLRKAIIFAFSIIPICFLIGFSGLLKCFKGLIISMFLVLGYIAFVLLDSVKWAYKQNDYELKKVNSIKYYVAFIVGWYILIFLLPFAVKSITGYETFEISTPSMEPSIKAGDRIMATVIKPQNLKIGDIITFTREDGQKYLSRAMGLPGQKIEIIDNKVSINDIAEKWEEIEKIELDEYHYQIFNSVLPSGRVIGTQKMLTYNNINIPEQEISNLKSMIIPKNQIYVIGDNRNNSMDSRMYGAISFDQIEKQVHYVWWSNDKSRIGKSLDE